MLRVLRSPDPRKANLTMLYPHPLPQWVYFLPRVADGDLTPEFEKPARWRYSDDCDYLAAVSVYESLLVGWDHYTSIMIESYMHLDTGDLTSAAERFRRALNLANGFGWWSSCIKVMSALATCYTLDGDHVRARLVIARMKAIAENGSEEATEAICAYLEALQWIVSDGSSGEVPDAERLVEAGTTPWLVGSGDGLLGMLHVAAGEHRQAAERFLRVAYRSQFENHWRRSIVWLLQAALAYGAAGDQESACVLWWELLGQVNEVDDAVLRRAVVDGAAAAGFDRDVQKAA